MLNVSGLQLTDLNFLKTLPHLIELTAADNRFVDSDYIATSIAGQKYLERASFAGCPAQKNDIYYRNKIILESKSLSMFAN